MIRKEKSDSEIDIKKRNIIFRSYQINRYTSNRYEINIK